MVRKDLFWHWKMIHLELKLEAWEAKLLEEVSWENLGLLVAEKKEF